MSDDSPRLKSLDALRGCAALVVVVFHCIQYIPALESNWVLHRLFPGSGAVLVFFVLSGLVLSMTYIYRDGEVYSAFMSKRFFRIWPAFAVSIAISFCLRQEIGYHQVMGASQTFLANWSGDASYQTFFYHLMMTGVDNKLNPPMWSLVQELRISIIFPVIVLLVVRNWPVALTGIIFSCLVISAVSETSAVMNLIAQSAKFIPLFVFGAILALKVKQLRHRIGSATALTRRSIWIICIFGVAMSADYSGSHLNLIGSIRLIVHGLAAAGIVILCATGGRVERWLSTPVPMFLGRISYSLYLIHVVVITAVVQLLEGFLSVPALVVLGAAASIVVATIMERYIEVPSARLGRRVAQSFAPDIRQKVI